MRKLEIGPGPKKIDRNWETLGIASYFPVDIDHDFMDLPLPIEDNTYDLIYSSHAVEHIAWFKVVDVLKEFYRILRPEGSIEIWTPNLKKIAEAYLTGKVNWRVYKRWKVAKVYNPERNITKWLNSRLFAYGGLNDDNPWAWHKSAFDEELLREYMEQAGFVDISVLDDPRTSGQPRWINLGMTGKK